MRSCRVVDLGWETLGHDEPNCHHPGDSDRASASDHARLRQAGRLFSPARGGYVPIPAEYRSWQAVPASHFIDPMMRHLDHDSYVAYLFAADLHGAAIYDRRSSK